MLQVYGYAKSNLAIINIFIKEPYSKRFRKVRPKLAPGVLLP